MGSVSSLYLLLSLSLFLFFFLVRCDQQPVGGGLWRKRLSSPQLAILGCGSLTFWLTDGDKPTGAPRSLHQALYICQAHKQCAQCNAPHASWGLVCDQAWWKQGAETGGLWPSTITLLIGCALEDKQGKNALIRTVWSERRNKGFLLRGEGKKW